MNNVKQLIKKMTEFTNVPIDFENIPQAEEVLLKPIERKYLSVKIVGDVLVWIILMGIIVAIKFLGEKTKAFMDEYFWYMIGACLLLATVTVVMDFMGFKWKGFAMREKDIIYRSGLIFRSKVHVPYNRVQHCEVNQGVLDRWLDLAKLKIYTAGGSRSDLTIPGLKNQDALNMKSFILKKTNEDESI